MIFVLVWIPMSCDFTENDTVVTLIEQATNADMDANDPRVLGPFRVQIYETVNWSMTGQSWTYQAVPYETEEDAMAAWVLVMEAPIEEPPLE